MSFSVDFRERYTEPNPEDDESILFLALTGPSESGKSAFGENALVSGIANRIKYLRAARELSTEKYNDPDPFAYFEKGTQDEKKENYQHLWERLTEISRRGTRISVIESLKHPAFIASAGRGATGICVRTIYVEASLQSRISREANRLQIPPDVVAVDVMAKDALKEQLGLQELKDNADIVIHNDGSYEEYLSWVDGYLRSLNRLYGLPKTQSATTPILYK